MRPIISNSGIGIGIKKGGLGAQIKVSSDGVTVGAGIGVLDLEYNLNNGTGKVGWGFGIYEMQVSRDGCNYVKDFYIAGVYTHTEYQRDPNCEEEFPDREEERDRERGLDLDLDEEAKRIIEEGRVEHYRPDPLRFPRDKRIIASFDSIFVRYISRISSRASFYFCRRTCSVSPTWSKEDFLSNKLFTPFRYPDNPNRRRLFDYKVNGWGADFTQTFSSGYAKTYSIQDEQVVTLVRGTNNIVLGNLGGGLGESFFYSFYCGTYGLFLQWISGARKGSQKYWANPRDSYKYDGTRLEAQYAISGVKFYDENGLIESPPLLPPPPPRPMNKDCCKKLDKRLERLESVLNTKQLIDRRGMKIERGLYSPGAKGKDTISDYANYLATLVRIQAQSGIFPFTIKVDDANLAQRGNQTIEAYYPTATDAIKSIAENTANQGTDLEALLNIGIRLGIASVRQQEELGWLHKTVDSIVGFLGFPRKERVGRISTLFDPLLGARKKVGFRGFGPAPTGTNTKIEKELKKILKTLEDGEPDALRKVLDSFLSEDDTPIRYEDFLDEQGAPTLMDIIQNMSSFKSNRE